MTRLARAETRRPDAFAAPELRDADAAGFRAAMRQLASGVCLITRGEGSERRGMTATAVASLSTDPPTLIVCVNRDASIYPGLSIGSAFGVSVLASDSREIADRYAGRAGVDGAGRFDEGRWRIAPSGVSLFADGIAAFECEVEDVIERPTHAIVIGRVLRTAGGAADGALVYWRGGYDSVGWSADELSRATGLTPYAPRRR